MTIRAPRLGLGFLALLLPLIAFAPPAGAQAVCPAPYHVTAPDGRCVWSCSQGTQPNNQTNECTCQPGLTETSTDQFGRRVCTKVAAACPAPYHVTAPDGRCVWSCSQGTQPNQQTNECTCRPGFTETSKDQFGRRVCTCPKPYHVTAPDGRCVWSCGQGTQPNQQTNECVCQPGLKDAGKDNFGRLTCKR